MGVHQPHNAVGGHAGQLRKRDLERVESNREAGGMEVPVGDDRLPVDQHHRVIAGRVELGLERAANAGQHVEDGAVNLHRRAEADRVLDAQRGRRGPQAAALEQQSHLLGRGELPRKRTGIVDLVVEHRGVATEALEAQRGCHVGQREQVDAADDRQRAVTDRRRVGTDQG